MTALDRVNLLHYEADKIEDINTRMVEARCLDKARSEIIHGNWGGDKTINRHSKRHRRKGYHYTTHLDLDGVPPDNNPVERVNRQMVAVRCDGCGNRTRNGMDANSIIFPVMMTDWINNVNFYEHLIRAASCDG